MEYYFKLILFLLLASGAFMLTWIALTAIEQLVRKMKNG